MVDEVLEDLRGALEAGGLQGVVLVLRLQEGVGVVSQEELGRLKSVEMVLNQIILRNIRY